MQISYTDTMGNRNMVEKDVQIGTQGTAVASTATDGQAAFAGRRSTSTLSVFSKYIWYFVIAILLVGGFITYRKYRVQKLLNPKFRFMDLFKKKKK